ncbi:MAG: flagellar hook-associated protein FlgL [Negativicutes bacterium]|nr:flagellar hook-associated protein FlgL [Negativicutes bacterium]
MIRITNSMMAKNTVWNINQNMQRLNTATNAESTEKKIQLASDDPIIATRALKYRNYVATVEQYQKNVSDASSWMSVTENSLSDLKDVLQQARNLTVEASSDALSDSDKADIADQVEQLKESAVQILNSTYAGRYVFGGYATDSPPYATTSTTAAITTNTAGYIADDIGVSNGLATGNYSVAMSGTSGSYTLTLTDPAGATYTATSTDGSATFTTASGAVVLEAPTTVTSPGTLAFTVSSGSTSSSIGNLVTFKGKYLDLGGVVSSSVSDTALNAFYAANTANAYSAGTDQAIKYNTGYGSQIAVNVEGQDVTGSGSGNLFDTLDKLLLALNGDTTYKTIDSSGTIQTQNLSIDGLLTDIDSNLNTVLTQDSDLGARQNYVALCSSRLANDSTTYTKLMSENEDVDIAQATMDVATAETVYNASLSVGAKAISQSLVDYLK